MSRLKELRQAAGLSRSELAEKSGIGIRTLESYEQGRRDIEGSAKKILAITHALNISVEDLAGADDDSDGL